MKLYLSCSAASHEDKYISNGGDNNARHLLGSNPTQLILQPVARLSFSSGAASSSSGPSKVDVDIYNAEVAQELIV